MADPRPNLFAMPPGADFPRALVAGLKLRMGDVAPEAMARVTVYLNTSKMRDRVKAAFLEEGPGLLPRLRIISDLGSDPLFPLPPAVPKLRRRLELAILVGKLIEQQRDFAPGTAVFDLADSLADLMEEMQAEGVSPDALESPGLAENHAEHWQRSLGFLRILRPWFAQGAAPDPAGRQRLAIEALIQTWQQSPPKDPVIIAGSTGSRGATFRLMTCVAGLDKGAVILPGFDWDMPDFGWNSLLSDPVPNEDHPQYRYARLLDALALRAGDVTPWPTARAPDPARNRLVSLALRPAPVTDQWLSEGRDLLPLGAAAAGLTLIEAKSPRQEAMSIALALRKAAEDDRRAVLLTPDRVLARRVAAALDQWGLVPDDSAGRPLHLSPPGRFLRQIADLFGQKVTVEALLALLKHPLTATGAADRGPHLLFTRELELKLRRSGPPFPDGPTLAAWAAARSDANCQAWADWLGAWIDAIPQAPEDSISAYTETLLRLSARLAGGTGGTGEASELWRLDAGEKTYAVLQTLRAEAPHGGTLSAGGFVDLLATLLQGEQVRQTLTAHPLIAIQGTREAREIQADLVILGGLNEGTWPAPARPDPWLSRQMRMKVGLLLPERQIGLAAHDVQLALAAPEAILTRAVRDDEAETVASRWLERLTNLVRGLEGDGGAYAAMRERGQYWLDLAHRLDQVAPATPASRPAPSPPTKTRPRELPVTAIRDLIRDPYAVYAKYILRLRPLSPLSPEPDARLRGQVLHRIVEDFVANRPESEPPEAARARLLATAERVLAEETPWPSAQRLWLGRIARIADRFVLAEGARSEKARPIVLEKAGGIHLGAPDFTLTARPDRIDQAEDGTLHIYDYKTGTPPTKDQQKYFEKQLLLEAAMAERGAFAEVGPHPVAATTYIHLGGKGDERTTARDDGDYYGVWQGLIRLISHYMTRGAGYSSRRAMFTSKDRGDYDHLARHGEWQASDRPEITEVGDAD